MTIKATAKSPDDLRTWTLPTEPISKLVVSQAGGPHTVNEATRTLTVVMPSSSSSSSKPTLTLEYDLSHRPPTKREDPSATIINEARFRIGGEALFALPTAFEKRGVGFRLAIDVDARPLSSPVVATSFGMAERHLHRDFLPAPVMAAELRRTAYLGGGGGHAIFDAQEGHDEIGWLGYTAFDPRPVASEVAVFRSTLRDHFRSADIGPQTLLFAVDERPKGHFRVQRRAAGLLVGLSGNDPFESTLRLAVAHELVHAWIGDRLWIGDPKQASGMLWFHEGYARWVAREQLYRVGLLSPDEYATEVNRLLGIVTTSPHAQRSLADLAADTKTGGVVPLLVARGALHATLVDHRIRTKNPKLSLDDVLRKHLKAIEDRTQRVPMPEAIWHDSIAEIVSPAIEKSDFEALVVVVVGSSNTNRSLPPDALGGCFDGATAMSFDIYDPGFDVAASRDAEKIIGLRANGPAAKAGLHDGDAISRIEEDEKELRITANEKAVAFKPSAGSKKGTGFRRRSGLSDDACRKLAIRK